MFLMVEPQFGNKCWLIRRSHRAPLIQQIEDTELIIINKFQHFDIIFEGNLPEFVLQTFSDEYLFLQFEYLFEIYLVESLVCVVYEKLFQTVHSEHLKTIDIQETER